MVGRLSVLVAQNGLRGTSWLVVEMEARSREQKLDVFVDQ